MVQHRVFVSHSRDDAEPARDVEISLGTLELTVSKTAPGLHSDPDWPRRVAEAISSSDLVVVLWSESAAGSPFVEFEWMSAAALGKAIVPCRLDDTPLPPTLSGTGVRRDTLSRQVKKLLSKASTKRSGGARSHEAEELLGKLSQVAAADGESMARASTKILAEQLGQSADAQETFVSGASAASSPPDSPTLINPLGAPAPDATTGEAGMPDFGKRYEVIKLLGQGGMGAVYQVHDRELDRDVALKLVKAEMARNPMVLERFKREIQLSSIVTHPNVLRVYDLGEGEGTKFLTMQLVEGEDLTQLMQREESLDLDRVLQIFKQVCEGLKAAHDKGILHRDLKPANIMLDKDGHVFLTDFGLARSGSHDTALTQVGELMGTPHYMSPEQVRSETLDQRSDIYSLGVILYEMATGKQPYDGNTVYEVMIQRTQRPPSPATSINPDIPPFLEHVIRRCMARDKEARYQDLGEVLDDLQQGIDTGKTLYSSRFQFRALTRAKRILGWKGVAGAVVLAVVLVAGGYWVSQRAGGGSAVVADQPHESISFLIADFVNMTGDPVFDGTIEQALTIGLEGASFVEAYRRERARSIALELKPDATRLDRDAARLVAQREGVDVVMTGTVDLNGNNYTIAIEAIDPFSGNSLTRQEVRAKGREDVLAAVGRLAIETRKGLGDVASDAELRASVETITSSSLEASEAYARGQALQQQGRWQDAIDRYQAAVELDPNMGRAYSGLAVMHYNLGQQEEAEKYFLTAMSKIDRMTPRERFRTRGNYYIVIRDYEKAVEEYSALVEEVPGDSLGRANLAYAAFFARDFQGAYEQARQIAEADPQHVVKRANLAWYAMIADDFDTAAKEARQTLNLDPSFKQTYIYLALTELALGDVEAARETWNRLAAIDADGASLASGGLADLASYAGDYTEAVRLLREDLAREEPSLPALKHAALAYNLMQLGDATAAAQSANRATNLSQRLAVVFEAALVDLRTGNSKRGLELAGLLTSSLQSEDQAYGKLLEGEAQRLAQEPREAIRLFREARQFADTWLGRLFLARAYLDAEAYTEAYSELEQCLARRGEATSIFLDEVPTYRYFPDVYYYMGEAQRGLQSPAAAESFRAFVEIRGDGNPDPRVEEARRAIASE